MWLADTGRWLADTSSAPSLDPLWQYGAIGLMLGCAIVGIRILYRRETDAHDADRARAEKAEQEVTRLNELIRVQYVERLDEAQKALQEAVTALNRARRRGGPAHRTGDDD